MKKVVVFFCLISGSGVFSKLNFGAVETFDTDTQAKESKCASVNYGKNEFTAGNLLGKRSTGMLGTKEDNSKAQLLQGEKLLRKFVYNGLTRNLRETSDRPKRSLNLDSSLFSKSGPDEIIDTFDLETYLKTQPDLHEAFSKSDSSTIVESAVYDDNYEHITRIKQPILIIPRPVIVEHYEQPIVVVHRSLPTIKDVYEEPIIVESEVQSILTQEVCPDLHNSVSKRDTRFYSSGCDPCDPYNSYNPLQLQQADSLYAPVVTIYNNLAKRHIEYLEASPCINVETEGIEGSHYEPSGSENRFVPGSEKDRKVYSNNDIFSFIRNYPALYPPLTSAHFPSSQPKFEYYETGVTSRNIAKPVAMSNSMNSYSNTPVISPVGYGFTKGYSTAQLAASQHYQSAQNPCTELPIVSAPPKIMDNAVPRIEMGAEESGRPAEESVGDLRSGYEPLISDLQTYSEDSVETDPQKRSSKRKEKGQERTLEKLDEPKEEEARDTLSQAVVEIPNPLNAGHTAVGDLPQKMTRILFQPYAQKINTPPRVQFDSVPQRVQVSYCTDLGKIKQEQMKEPAPNFQIDDSQPLIPQSQSELGGVPSETNSETDSGAIKLLDELTLSGKQMNVSAKNDSRSINPSIVDSVKNQEEVKDDLSVSTSEETVSNVSSEKTILNASEKVDNLQSKLTPQSISNSLQNETSKSPRQRKMRRKYGGGESSVTETNPAPRSFVPSESGRQKAGKKEEDRSTEKAQNKSTYAEPSSDKSEKLKDHLEAGEPIEKDGVKGMDSAEKSTLVTQREG